MRIFIPSYKLVDKQDNYKEERIKAAEYLKEEFCKDMITKSLTQVYITPERLDDANNANNSFTGEKLVQEIVQREIDFQNYKSEYVGPEIWDDNFFAGREDLQLQLNEYNTLSSGNNNIIV